MKVVLFYFLIRIDKPGKTTLGIEVCCVGMELWDILNKVFGGLVLANCSSLVLIFGGQCVQRALY